MATPTLLQLLRANPIIASITDEEGLRKALESRCGIIFVLFGNICNIASIIKRIHDARKLALVHCDLVEGISSKEIVVDYLKNTVKADGIISAKASLLKAAKKKQIYTVHRFFLIDSLSFNSLPKQYACSQADIIEIMPGCISPKVLAWVREKMRLPLIASGLVCDRHDALAALEAGATAISTSSYEIWDALVN